MKTKSLSLLALAAVLVACTQAPPAEHACTLIGCDNALTITLQGNASQDLRIELASTEGGAAEKVIDCATQSCAQPIRLSGYTPERLSVRIVRGGTERERRTVQPIYTESRPNGPDCPPVCRFGDVTLTV